MALIKISYLAMLIKYIVGYEGNIIWDDSKPDGAPKKLLDSSYINDLGWKPKISLLNGIQSVYNWYLLNSSK